MTRQRRRSLRWGRLWYLVSENASATIVGSKQLARTPIPIILTNVKGSFANLAKPTEAVGTHGATVMGSHERGAESAVLEGAFLSARWVVIQIELRGLAIRTTIHPAERG